MIFADAISFPATGGAEWVHFGTLAADVKLPELAEPVRLARHLMPGDLGDWTAATLARLARAALLPEGEPPRNLHLSLAN